MTQGPLTTKTFSIDQFKWDAKERRLEALSKKLGVSNPTASILINSPKTGTTLKFDLIRSRRIRGAIWYWEYENKEHNIIARIYNWGSFQ